MGLSKKTLPTISHEDSVLKYPHLGLCDDEYVVLAVERSKIGMVYIWLTVIFSVAIFVILTQFVSQMTNDMTMKLSLIGIGYLVAFIIICCGLVESSIYKSNFMIITNQRAFSRMQNSPFAHVFQAIELENIEDVSFHKPSVLANIFNYGTLRLSTVGDEHTYAIKYTKDPEAQIRIVNEVVNKAD